MDRVLNTRDEKQTIYEIYRACRLCGAGAGYKMPIIQNVVKLEADGIELRQKIKECVQIEVNHTDRMPPLICELCVDKVNDFYEFLDMCKQNNRRTRQRLGLPLHTPSRDSTENENCILGVTEPVFITSNAEPLNKHKSKKNKAKNELVDVKIKTNEKRPSPKPEPKPIPLPRTDTPDGASWAVLSRGRPAPRPGSGQVPEPRRATRQSTEPVIVPIEDMVLLERKLKRARESETKNDTPPPSKKVKIPEAHKIPNKLSKTAPKEQPKTTPKPQPKPAPNKDRKPSPPPKTTSKLSHPKTPSKPLPKNQPSKPLPSKSKPLKTPEAPKVFSCSICNMQTKTIQGLVQHNNIKHVPAFTSPRHACNACELWFLTTEEAASHHKHHRTQNVPYKCTRCYGYFKLQQAYEEHFGLGQCLSEWEVPDARCVSCWRTFPTGRLLEEHRCAGEDGRPGGKCVKCKRSYALLKNLVKHESTCTHRKKGDTTPGLLTMQVRVARCDPLLAAGAPVRCGALPQNYGLDSSCQYPYFRPRVKTEPLPMVAIQESVKHEFNNPYCVDSLSALCLQNLQAKKSIKAEPFDQFDDISAKINSIIDHLASEDSQSGGSDSILNNESRKEKEGEAADELTLKSSNYESNNVENYRDDKESEEAVEKTNSVDNEVKEIDDKLVVNEPSNVLIDNVSVESENVSDSSNYNNVTESLNNGKVTDSFDVKNDIITNTEEKKEIENNENELEVSEKNVNELKVSENNENKLELSENHDTDEISKNDNLESNIDSKRENELVNNNDSQHAVDENMEASKDIDDSASNNTDNNENFSKIDEITNKILENQESNVDKDSKDNFTDENTNKIIEDNEKSTVSTIQDHNSDSRSAVSTIQDHNSDSRSAVSTIQNVIQDHNSDSRLGENGVDSQDKFNVDDLSEDDRKLMAELDEQIGENEQKVCDSQISENDNRISVNDNRVSENDNRTSENDNRISENDNRISENDNRVSENDNRISENDNRNSENDNRISENDNRVSENDNRVSENDNRVSENDNRVSENDNRSGEKDKTIENSQKSRNHYIDELIKKQDSEMRSLDLDSISDDEFNFDI